MLSFRVLAPGGAGIFYHHGRLVPRSPQRKEPT